MNRAWLRSLLLASLLSTPFISNAGDWPGWRGPEQNGVSRETSLPDTWDPDTGENLVWKVPVGGQGTPIIMGDRLYTLTRLGEVKVGDPKNPETVTAGPETQEGLVCVNVKTGTVEWTHAYNMTQSDVPFWRVGWSNPVGDTETGNVYSLGTQCTLSCLDGKSGKTVWERQLTEEFGFISTFGGRTPSAMIDGDLLICAGVSFGWGDNARGTHRIYAFNKKTGELVWTNGVAGIPTDAGYNTPVVTTINGERIVMFAAGDGTVDAYKVNTGERIWAYPISKRGTNVSLVMEGTKVYACTDLDNFDTTVLGSVVCLDFGQSVDGKPKQIWRKVGIESGYGSPTIYNGRLYVVDNKSTIFCLDAETGKQAWKKNLGTIGKGSLLFADGKIYVPEANGKVFILQPGDKDCKILSKVEIPEKLGREYATYGQMAVANGRVYLQSATTLYSIGFKEPNLTGFGKPIPAEPALKGEGPVAWVQVTPADIVVHPGEKINFTVKTFDAKGNFLAEVKDAEWSIGQLNAPVVPKTGPNTAPAATKAATGSEYRLQPASSLAKTVIPAPQSAMPLLLADVTSAPAMTAPATTATPKIGNLKGTVKDGVFTAEAGPFQGGGVFAKVGNVTGFARVRVMPPTPWKFDFESTPDGVPPLTWVGAGGKFAVRTLEEGGQKNKVLVKLTTVPLYDRARTNFGTPDMTGYTLQADIEATSRSLPGAGPNGSVLLEMPDAGIINQRYVLCLMGNDQKAQINVWQTMLPYSINKTMDFKWQPGKWYTFKLKVEQLDKTAHVSGKIWEKGTPEPADWMLQLDDKIPNRNGNPGLFAYSFKSLEIFYDNVLLTPNK